MASKQAFVAVDYADGVIEVELRRPDRLNALSLQMAEEMVAAASEFAGRPEARVLVLCGAGRAFCAGYDVSSEGDSTSPNTRDQWVELDRFQSLFEAFERLPVIRVAAVHGHCVGAGLVLATLCELRYAADSAQFSVPELDLGYPFSMAGLPRLARYIGLTRTADMVLNGIRLDAVQAREEGLITEVVDDGQLYTRVVEVARTMASRPGLLLLQTATALREAGQSLVDASRSDLAALLLAQRDADCQQVTRGYAARFASGSR